MRTLVLTILAVFLNIFLFAQNDDNKEIKTIFGNSHTNGGYGAPVYRFGFINNKPAFINGGKGAWLTNHQFAFGGGAYNFSTQIMYDQQNQQDFQLSGGYGGLMIEPIFLYRFPMHLAFPVFFGAGGISYTVKDYNTEDYIMDTKAFFVVEPGMEVELNMLRFFRLNFGAYYRFTDSPILEDSKGMRLESVSENALNDLSFGITFKFGKF